MKMNKIQTYFRLEWKILILVTISGLIYNLGLLAGPWFEGKMAACLADILYQRKTFRDMLYLVLFYVLSIAVVQICRYVKRFYVRRFANNVNRRMKHILYGSLVRKSRASLREEGAGDLMTKAILDVDDCAEGMRKFTTEIFDTGVALLAYIGMLLYYDWRLTLLCMIFPPVSYILAEKMKVIVQRTNVQYKKQSALLSNETLDRGENAVTYRVFGRETKRQKDYEENLCAYEKAAVHANIWNAVMPPLYRMISMTGLLFFFYFGVKNVLGTGWKVWDIAVFTTFLSCFIKLSVKSSSAAKLFNAVHKAQVSWKRIRPLMNVEIPEEQAKAQKPDRIEVSHLSFAYPGGECLLKDLNFILKPGEITGITGEVASGKSTLGKVFLCEYPYKGSITFQGRELQELSLSQRREIISYLGHEPELFDDTIENNILMGDDKNAMDYLKMVCLDKEVMEMEDGIKTKVGMGGVRLSGGQAQRLALARTLCHKKPVMILDDPFSALDKITERQIFASLKAYAGDSSILLISHRLYLFSEMNQVLWLKDGRVTAAEHEEMLRAVLEYKKLFDSQQTQDQKGADHEAE